MRTNAFILLCLMGLSGLSAHAQTESRNETNDPKVNIGIKAGFNSTMFFIDHFTLGENELQDMIFRSLFLPLQFKKTPFPTNRIFV